MEKIRKEDKKVEKLFNTSSIVLGIVGGIACKYLGGWDGLLKTMLALAILDYGTGIIKAVMNKKVSSEVGFKGILKKVLIFVVIAVAHVIQELTGGGIPLREIVIVFYIANEGLSILENVALYIPVPEKIKDVLLQLRNKEVEGE